MISQRVGMMVLLSSFFFLSFGKYCYHTHHQICYRTSLNIYTSSFSPNAVDINGAQKMSVPKRLEYAFDIANKEFGVPSLLDPSG